MEILSKNSYVPPEQYSFEIQEIKENPTKIDLLIREDQNKDVTKRYVSHLDLIESSALMDQEKIFDENTKMILLQQNQASDCNRTNNMSHRVIELSDSDSKMVLQQQFRQMAKCGNSNLQSNTVDENIEILRKLPPDTIVIRQKAKSDIENGDYRVLTEINNGNNSVSGYTDIKMRGISRALRNKT